MTIEEARGIAAQAWCKPTTSNKVMDVDLAEEFAKILSSISCKEALNILKNAFKADYNYAWGWHCNMACCASDEGVEYDKANRIAARFMKLAFDVDTSKGEGGK